MHGLHEMTCAVRAQPVRARGALILGRDRSHDILDCLVTLPRSANHDRRTIPRALFPSGNAHTKETQALFGQGGRAPSGVIEIRIAGVDYQVPLVQERHKGLDHRIYGIARLHHDNNGPGHLQRGDQILKFVGRCKPRSQRSDIRHERIDLVVRAVVHRHVKALVRHVQRQRRTHGAKPRQPDPRHTRPTSCE